MDGETRRELLDIIGDIGYSSKTASIINMLYGLFDGYLYDELITEVECVKSNRGLYRRIIRMYTLCGAYPMYYRDDSRVEEILEEVEGPIEWVEGMGVGEGKRYLASLEN
jgi:hypothetical protein